jgi:hypothetical protein
MKDSRKEFIKQAHESACSEWKEKIEQEFPELFKKDALVVGKWYRSNGNLFNVMSVMNNTWCLCYGFDSDGWLYESKRCINNLYSVTLATDKEVEEALIKEAKKKGLKPLNHRCIKDGLIWNDNIGGKYEFDLIYNTLDIGASCAFKDGKWATIVETITKEQAEKELGKTILN